MNKEILFDIPVDNVSEKEALSKIEDVIKKERKCNVFFLNTDYLYKAQKDQEYRNILQENTDILFCDGIGLKLLFLCNRKKMISNNNGTDRCPKIMKLAKNEGKSIFLLGGFPGVAEKAGCFFREKIPGLKISGVHDGYFKNDREIIRLINESKAEILFVGLGAPKQEKWIIKNRSEINANLCIGVGGLFDYYSGRIKRAPKIIRRMYLEWLWRFCIEPKRLFKRYFIDSFMLIFIFLKKNFIKNNVNQ